MEPVRKTDGRVQRGERTRKQILDGAVDLASVEGLEGLSIGGLALRLGMSKSGLFAAFGSKLDLQLAAVDHAAKIFVEEVVRPGLAAPRGLPRLWALCDSWLDYASRQVFEGGCFFSAASIEFDGRPGPVRERVASHMKAWLETLATAVRKAQQEGHLRKNVEPDQLAFEVHALAMGANWAFQLFGDKAAFDRARKAFSARIENVSERPVRLPHSRRGRARAHRLHPD